MFCKIKNKKTENIFSNDIFKLMYMMFTYGDNYVGKETSTNCEDPVHICILFCNKSTPECVAFLSMLMVVELQIILYSR